MTELSNVLLAYSALPAAALVTAARVAVRPSQAAVPAAADQGGRRAFLPPARLMRAAGARAAAWNLI